MSEKDNKKDNKKYIVDCYGNGDFVSVGEALATVSDGDEIIINSGIYTESLVIDKAVKISGNKEDMPVISIESGRVCLVSAEAEINYIHFNNSNGQLPDEERYGFISMVEATASAVFNNCDFSCSFDGNIKVYGDGIRPEFNQCNIHDANRNGVFLIDGCKAVFRDCQIYNNGFHGISIVNASPFIENCVIHDVGSHGIFAVGDNHGFYNFEDSDLNPDFKICYQANPIVKNCQIYNIQNNSGLSLSGNCLGTFENCIFKDSPDTEIEQEASTMFINCDFFNDVIVKNNAAPMMVNCRISNGDCGISLNDNASGIYENCEISNCDNCCIEFYDSSSGAFRNCRILTGETFNSVHSRDNTNPLFENCRFEGGTYSIYTTDESKGLYINCDVSGAYHVLRIEDNSSPMLKKCKLYKAGDTCVDIWNTYNLKLIDCEIYDSPSGIQVINDSTPLIYNCRIYNCENSGIKVFDHAGGVIENCTIFNTEGPCIQLSDNSKTTVKGCTLYNASDSETYISGINIFGSYSGTIKDCVISNIDGNGIICQEFVNANIENCNIYNCSSLGIKLMERVKCNLRNCVIHDIERRAISLEDRASANIENCEIYKSPIGLIMFDYSNVVINYIKIHGIEDYGILLKDCVKYDLGKPEFYDISSEEISYELDEDFVYEGNCGAEELDESQENEDEPSDYLTDVNSKNPDFSINNGCLDWYSGFDDVVVIPKGVTEIGDEAFAEYKNLKSIFIPESVVNINFSFSEYENLIIHGRTGSFAEKYAEENGITFAGDL